MLRLFLILILSISGCCEFYSTKQCECEQLYEKQDCVQNQNNCQWLEVSNRCLENFIPISISTPLKHQNFGYCESINQREKCLSQEKYNICQWNVTYCSFFTGCTALHGTIDSKCQELSNKCITNGEYCIEIQECNQYYLKKDCKKSISGKYCNWNNALNTCQDVMNCEELPQYLKTDQECRQQLSYCTVNLQGGCQQSGENCSDQISEKQCYYNKSLSQICFWDQNTCKEKNCSNASNSIVDEKKCQIFLQNCTLKASGGCRIKTSCEEAINQEACSSDINYSPCIWFDKKCYSRNCKNAPLTFNSVKQCKDFSSDCTLKAGGGCKSFSYCKDIETEYACDFDYYGKRCIFDTICRQEKCEEAPTNFNTQSQCSQYNQDCIVKSSGGCQQKKHCKDFTTQSNCVIDEFQNPCYWNDQQGCIDESSVKCSELLDSTSCSNQKLKQKQCIWGEKCFEKECVFAPKDYQTDDDCFNYDSRCTLSKGGGCQERPLTCGAHLSEESCQYRRSDTWILVQCVWTNKEICIDKNEAACEDLPFSFTTNNQCKDFSFYCVLNNPDVLNGKSFGCMTNKKCIDKKVKENCETINYSTQEECYWNQTTKQCQQKTCTTTIADESFTSVTSQNCYFYSTLDYCIKNNDETGCMQFESCNKLSYFNCEDEYIFKLCFWNGIKCVDNICSNLPFKTQQDCQQQNDICAVNNQKSNCQEFAQSCNEYKLEENCQQAQFATECFWDQIAQQCFSVSCFTASNQMQTHQECNNYLFECTVKAIYEQQSDIQVIIHKGCIPLSNCSSYISEEQCQINQYHQPCGWNGFNCADKSCLTAPVTDQYSTHELCQLYLEGCTVNSNLLGCMSIPKTCEEMMIEQQCIQTDSGDECFWLSMEAKCIKKTCEIAPSSFYSANLCNQFMAKCTQYNQNMCYDVVCEDFKLTTEEECKNAKSECTTDGYKCVKKHPLCEGALAQAGCTTNSNGQKCEWVTDYGTPHCVLRTCETAPLTLITEKQCQDYLSPKCTTKYQGGCTLKLQCQNATVNEACTPNLEGRKCIWENSTCRDIRCDDLYGKTDENCKKQQKECTVGLNNKCAEIKQCEDTLIKDACILGLNGPCLWINDYVNLDKSKGACFQFSSCNSLKWTSDEMCKLISPYCTTDGQSCVSVTYCSLTNTSGGCITGIDGDCLQITENEKKVCKLFNGCSEAKYFTHFECQQANKKCTAHPVYGCFELTECEKCERQESCYSNFREQIIENGQILSTGKCVWSEENKKCRDQTCIDLIFTTHQDCFEQLKYCTTNGTNCIQQLNCDQYKEENSCQYGMDGICIWQNQSCRRMKSCTQANDNEHNCKKVADRCYWEQASSQCLLHSCDTYFKTFKVCTKLFNINKSLQQFCSKNSFGQCVEIQPENFSQSECQSISENSFRWYQSKCQVCQELKKIPDQAQLNVTFSNSINPFPNHVESFSLLLGSMVLLIMN